MKADVKLGHCVIIGVEGTDIEDIKNKVAYEESLNDYGKSLLIIIPRTAENE